MENEMNMSADGFGKSMKLGDKEWNALEWAMEYTIEMLNEHSDEDDPERLEVLATLEKIEAVSNFARSSTAHDELKQALASEVACTNCHKRWRVTDSWATAVFFGAKDGDQLCGACYDTQEAAQ